MRQVETKLKAGDYLIPATLIYKDKRIWIKVRYNKKVIAEIKRMEGPKWHGFDDKPIKMWSITDSQRNAFQLDYLQKKNPYAIYEKPLVDFSSDRPLYEHQRTMVRQGLTVNYGIWAAEMGTGKTLAMIELLEHIDGLRDHEVYYIGPKSGVKAVNLELLKWQSKILPEMMTYEGLTKVVRQWEDGKPAPRVVIFDESSKIKNPTSQRSQASLYIADAVRSEWGNNGYIICMSGTPAPKTPVDWWMQCEVARPGFLVEGNIHKFKKRLCIVEERETMAGGVYPHVVSWLDNSSKCAKCGEYADAGCHDAYNDGDYHNFRASVNEVDYLYRRMKGLVLVLFKKDCLDLPEKQYRIINVKPTVEILRAARLIRANSTRAVQVLTLMRELSDGFQYKEVQIGKITCPNCRGEKTVIIPILKEGIEITDSVDPDNFEMKKVICDNCGGAGEVPQYARETDTVGSPKDEIFKDLLDEHADVGRFIVWGGFTGSIDRLVEMSNTHGWATLRIDGRGYIGQTPTGDQIDDSELLIAMDRSHPRFRELLEKYPKVCVVGHPQAGGMALTLTASPTELFYSNCFNGEARMQAEDRFHRPGMDENRGATIIDLIMMPTDELVLNNLKLKKKLQDISMGELDIAIKDHNNVIT